MADCNECINKDQCWLFGCLKEHRLWEQVKGELLAKKNSEGQIPPKFIWKAFERVDPPKVPQSVKDKYWYTEVLNKARANGLLTDHKIKAEKKAANKLKKQQKEAERLQKMKDNGFVPRPFNWNLWFNDI